VVPQGLDVFSLVVLGGDFRSPLLVISLGCFWDLSLGELMGEICGNPSGSLGSDSPPKSVSKGALFWGILEFLGWKCSWRDFLDSSFLDEFWWD
jgi:hypothetical protein